MSYIIRIGSTSDTAGLDKAGNSLRKVGTDADAAKAKLGGLNGAFGNLSTSAKLWAAGLVAGAGAAMIQFGASMAAGVKHAADFAGEVSDLSARTGQTASDVIVLGQAFRNAGLGSDMVGQSLNLLQKALTGVNENGEPTAGVFQRLGLSIDDLKGMSAVDQLEAISKAIASLKNPADQTRAAMEMFGRSGGQLLAVLKDTEAFTTARTQVGGLANNIQQSAADLDKFSDAVDGLDTKQMQFFAGLAYALAGDLGTAADNINRIDLTRAGEEMGYLAKGAKAYADEIIRAAKSVPSGGGIMSALGPLLKGGFLTSDIFEGLSRKGKDKAIAEGLDQSLGSPDFWKGLADKKNAVAPAPAAGPTGPEYGPGGDLEAIAKAKEYHDAMLADQEKEADLRDKKQRHVDEISRRNAEEYENEQKRLAAKSAELDLETLIAEARAGGNDAELKRLEWLKEYNRLLADGAREDQARRAANASSVEPLRAAATDPTKGGDLFGGTNHRRGANESDAFHESALNLAPGASLLDQYKANQSRAVGSINGTSILPADPLSSLRPTSASNPGGESAKSGVADAGKEASQAAKSAGDEAAAAVRELGSTIAGGMQGIKQQLSAVKSQVQALIDKV